MSGIRRQKRPKRYHTNRNTSSRRSGSGIRAKLRRYSNTLILLAVIIVAVGLITTGVHKRNATRHSNEDAHTISGSVMEYESLIDHYAKKYRIRKYKEYLLAIMQVESGGYHDDLMQSSESAGLPMNTLADEDSIRQGCKYFSECLKEAKKAGCDVRTAVQSYNYGKGFIKYVAGNGGKYTCELAESFARKQSGGETIPFNTDIAVKKNGGWRYKYGNMFYVPLVEQYVTTLREFRK